MGEGRSNISAPHKRPKAPRRHRRWLRGFGAVLIITGIAVLAWSFVVWRWNDPVTSLYTRWEQAKLNDRYAALYDRLPTEPVAPPTANRAVAVRAVERAADAFRARARQGDPIGHIIVPRLALNAILVNGTDTSSLRKGPGRDIRTFVPGQGQLIYIAGHRTTFSAPFSHIDRLVPGDRITLKMPYGTFVYDVTGHSIVAATDMSVLRSHGREIVALQACHPRFFATQRYIVWARPVALAPRGGRLYGQPLPSSG
jgi:sortase A